jgi:hypothetical protein
MRLWRASQLVLAAAVAVIIGLALAGVGSGLALLAYVLFIAALVFMWLIGRLGNVLPLAPDFQRALARPERAEPPVEQFETVKRSVILAGASQADLYRLRPLVREIVAARLSRRYGIDVDREPERVRSILGDKRAWEFVRPDAPTRSDRDAPGWSQSELEELVEELESL